MMQYLRKYVDYKEKVLSEMLKAAVKDVRAKKPKEELLKHKQKIKEYKAEYDAEIDKLLFEMTDPEIEDWCCEYLKENEK